jgi:hypothetical protein
MKPILLAIVLVVAATAAAADPVRLPTIPIRVTSGSVNVTAGSRVGPPESGPLPAVRLIAPDFELTGGGTGRVDCHFGCLPGEQFNLSTRVFVRSGILTFQGESIEFDAFFGTIGSASIDLVSPTSFVVPTASSGSFVFRSPFRLDGAAGVPTFLPPDTPDGDPIPAQRSFSFEGDGTATGTFFFEDVDGTTLFRFDTLRFDFDGGPAPIPEPGTLLLLGGGVAAAVVRQHKKRSRRGSPRVWE